MPRSTASQRALRATTTFCACLVAAILVSGCIPSLGVDLSNLCEGVGPLASITASPPSATLQVGDSIVLSVTQRDAKGNDRFLCGSDSVTWSSQSSSIASISAWPFGVKVRGVAVGETTVSASVAALRTDVRITVRP